MNNYLVLHSTNLRDTMFFDGEVENDIFNAEMARAAVKAYKATALEAPINTQDRLYQLAGIIKAENLDHAFRATNNVDGTENWDNRSTSVGDVFIQVDAQYNYVEDGVFVVDGFGFCQLAGV